MGKKKRKAILKGILKKSDILNKKIFRAEADIIIFADNEEEAASLLWKALSTEKLSIEGADIWPNLEVI